jgi:hypothetical protein
LIIEQLDARLPLAIETQLVKDIDSQPENRGSDPTNFVQIGSSLYFAASTNGAGIELWKSDGTVAGTVAQIMELGPYPFQKMRNTRNWNRAALQDAGWHLSWLGGQAATLAKIQSFCHPEVAERTLLGLETDR